MTAYQTLDANLHNALAEVIDEFNPLALDTLRKICFLNGLYKTVAVIEQHLDEKHPSQHQPDLTPEQEQWHFFEQRNAQMHNVEELY